MSEDAMPKFRVKKKPFPQVIIQCSDCTTDPQTVRALIDEIEKAKFAAKYWEANSNRNFERINRMERRETEYKRAIDDLRKALEFIRDNTDETLANNVAFKALKGTDSET